MNFLSCAVTGASFALICGHANAQSTLTVPTQFATIQVAIDAAVNGDTVEVLPGIYFERIDFGGKAITVRSTGGAAATTLDGSGIFAPNGPNAVVRFDDAEGADSMLQGFTVTGAESFSSGFSIYATGATPTLADCVIRDNQSSLGGGYSGGGSLINCEFRNNIGSVGGAVYGTADVLGCLIENNLSVFGPGGGIHATGPCTILDCRILFNSTGFDSYDGGGIYGPASISYCLVAGNFIQPTGFSAHGAGIQGAASVDHCTVVNNSISTLPCQPFVSCAGGGIHGSGPVTNSIVRGNIPDQVLFNQAVTFSNVEGPVAGAGNFDSDPLFTSSATGDFSLQSTSPCIDAGDPLAPLDADGSPTDVGAFPLIGPLTADVFAISLATGGQQSITLDASSALAGGLYLTAGSANGTSPGIPLPGGLLLPLQPDAYFSLTLGSGSPIAGAIGTLDGNGMAQMSITLPAGLDPGLAGLHLDHAAVALDGTFAVALVTNPVPISLIP